MPAPKRVFRGAGAFGINALFTQENDQQAKGLWHHAPLLSGVSIDSCTIPFRFAAAPSCSCPFQQCSPSIFPELAQEALSWLLTPIPCPPRPLRPPLPPPKSFDPRSLARLAEVHPDLQKLAVRALALSPVDFIITEGLRTLERQKALLAQGATRTLDSRHLTGHAIDVAARVDGEVRWDWPLYGRIADAFAKASQELAIPVTWGGSWKSFRDGPHFELPRDRYPAPSQVKTVKPV